MFWLILLLVVVAAFFVFQMFARPKIESVAEPAGMNLSQPPDPPAWGAAITSQGDTGEMHLGMAGAEISPANDVGALLRGATVQADLKNWDAALALLVAAKEGLILDSTHYPIDTWCKYPLYLSRAGRFEESMREFDWLIDDLPRRARKESFMDDPNVSFGKKTSKKSIYNSTIKINKEGIERNRQVALRRMDKAAVKLAPQLAPAPPLAMDEMRDQMNKAAYEMVGNTHDAETKARFKQGMTEFASADPLVKEIVVRVRALVEESPGLLQSGIYSSIPEYSQEQVRYALYFAHELGWVFRKKKGRSYQLFPPGATIEVPAL
jgi:hypothetical protein